MAGLSIQFRKENIPSGKLIIETDIDEHTGERWKLENGQFKYDWNMLGSQLLRRTIYKDYMVEIIEKSYINIKSLVNNNPYKQYFSEQVLSQLKTYKKFVNLS